MMQKVANSAEFLASQKFCVLGPVSRAGSTLLLDILGQHSDITCLRSEPFQKEEIDSFFTPEHQCGFEYIASRLTELRSQICGFKLLSHQPPPEYCSALAADFADLIDYLVSTRFRILLIERQDLKAWMVSQFLAEVEGAYHGKEYSSGIQRIPSDYVLRTLNYLRNGREITSRILEAAAKKYSFSLSRIVYPVCYENLVSNRNQTMAQVQTFLGVTNPSVLYPPAHTIKQAVKPISEYVSNLEEVEGIIGEHKSETVAARLGI